MMGLASESKFLGADETNLQIAESPDITESAYPCSQNEANPWIASIPGRK